VKTQISSSRFTRFARFWLPVLFFGLASAALHAQPRKAASKPAVAVAAPSSAPVAPMSHVQGTRCGEEAPGSDAAGTGPALEPSDPRSHLVELAERAQQRSRSVGVASLLEDAAREDLREAQAAHLPQVQVSISTLYAGRISNGVRGTEGAEGRAGLQVVGPLWDWGRNQQLVEWRRQLAESAAAGRSQAAEQVALQTVSLSLDRSRYALQAQVYGQYVRKMACLVEQLETVTGFDKGRASELVQAQKSQQQAELALAGTRDALKSIETRLRRLVGDPLPAVASLAAVLSRVPELSALQKDLLAAPDVAQAQAQALAANRLAESVVAGQKPQVGYLGSVNTARGNGNNSDWAAGVQVTIPLWRAGDTHQRDAARRRAEAANVQRDETLEAKTWRLQEMHDSAGQALDRARRVTELLRSSQTLRSATLQQWQQLGRRSLFDVMGAEADYYALRVAHVNAIYDAQQAVALMGSMGRGVLTLLR
jgi:outer membrane protein, adhesin transport system